MKTIVVIGGGASGIMAAISAKEKSPISNVIILENKDRIGKKILVTGNGRCNITNKVVTNQNFHSFNEKHSKFAKYALEEFDTEKTMKWFHENGLLLREEKNGKIFPFSGQAASVVDILRFKLENLNIEVIADCKIVEIKYNNKNENFTLISVNKKHFKADKVIVATGGTAYPNLGSDGSGYKLLENFGHTITKEIKPALVPITIDDKFTKSMEGIKFQGIATLIHRKCSKNGENVEIAKEEGEILFTAYGLSGPPILQISGFVNNFKENTLSVKLDFMPKIDKSELVAMLFERKKLLSRENNVANMEHFFTGFINKKCGMAIGKKAGIEKMSLFVKDLSDMQIEKISELLKSLVLDVIATKDFSMAQVTYGGVLSNEFCDRTMESKIIKGLFVTGEMYEFYGDCGGFNLQWAWSSGFIAGRNSVKDE